MTVNSLSNVFNGTIKEGTADIATIPFGSLQVVVESQAPELVQSLLQIYSGAVTPGTSEDVTQSTSRHRTVYNIVREAEDEGPCPSYTVIRDREVPYRHYPAEGLINCLEWDISDVVSRSLTGYHRIHAGALAHNGHGLLLPGASGFGKSTTVAALTLHGFVYCSDEYAMVGPDVRLYPFPKIISLKTGGWRQIVLDFPDEVSRLGWPNVSGNGIWQVKAPIVPDKRQSQAGYPIDFIIVSRYQPGQGTDLAPISRSVALKELIEQSLDLQLRGKDGLAMLVELVREADCYSLSISSLKEAAELVKELTL
jgi:hypothetical protein